MKATKGQNSFFTKELMKWHALDNDRSLPWKGEKDPYKIWLSEIILQQTRAMQGKPYYLRFIDAFPTIHDMATADEEKVYRLWQGLGYYNRCKNMLATARQISDTFGGAFPDEYDHLLCLKGIGPYTAAAIASFAFGKPVAVVDGNVYRVLSRYFGIEEAIDTGPGKKMFQELAGDLLDTSDSAAYNQAIMDLGATVCIPRQPACDKCPLQKKCVAYSQDIVAELPVKSKKVAVRKRYFHYLVLLVNDHIWLHKRNEGDIWQNLYEPYLIEADNALDKNGLLRHPSFMGLDINGRDMVYEGVSRQRLTHQYIEAHFYVIRLQGRPKMGLHDGKWLPIADLGNIAFPKTLVSFLEKKLYF